MLQGSPEGTSAEAGRESMEHSKIPRDQAPREERRKETSFQCLKGKRADLDSEPCKTKIR